MDFPIHIDTVSHGLPIVDFKGSQVEVSKLSCISVPDLCFNLRKRVQTLMKCSIMLHFIWVFTVCQSTGFGVSSKQRVNSTFLPMHDVCEMFHEEFGFLRGSRKFCQRGSKNTALNGPTSTRQLNAFRLRADDGSTLNACLVAL